jgi:hypothetical protein
MQSRQQEEKPGICFVPEGNQPADRHRGTGGLRRENPEMVQLTLALPVTCLYYEYTVQLHRNSVRPALSSPRFSRTSPGFGVEPHASESNTGCPVCDISDKCLLCECCDGFRVGLGQSRMFKC